MRYTQKTKIHPLEIAIISVNKYKMIQKESISDVHSYLSFQLGEELFAAPVEKVLEIQELIRITQVPHAPSYMRGIINLRGNALPVIDTRMKFGIPPTPDTVNTCIIILSVQNDHDTLILGALVDAVHEVLEINQNEIKSAPTLGNRYKSEFIKGLIHLKEQFIMLLDIDCVFSSEEIMAVQHSSDQPVI